MSPYELVLKESTNLDLHSDHDHSILDNLLKEAEKVGRSWSGSYLGYHSRVYYENFAPPPPGAHFSTEWGLYSEFSSLGVGCTGNWREYEYDDVINHINQMAGNPQIGNLISDNAKAVEILEDVKSNISSILHSLDILDRDQFLQKLASELDKVNVPSARDFEKHCLSKVQISTRDSRVEHKLIIPPHKQVECKVYEILAGFSSAKNAKKIIERISNHLKNLEEKMDRSARVGTNIFIGHGRSKDWRDLKDFLSERLNLPWDEFNRVAVAGLSNVTRLAQMLDHSCIAFLVMTAEDELCDGNHHARMNVIHEVGLFQGRLGFEKAIVLLEDGCEEFSNIQGLGQIRYPKGNISAIFEDIRRVLEREGVV